MHFGKFDVTEGQLCVMGFMLATTIFGPGLWDVKVGETWDSLFYLKTDRSPFF